MSEEQELAEYLEKLICKYIPSFYNYKGMRPRADVPEKGTFGDLYTTSDTKEVLLWQPIGEHWNILPIEVFEECLLKLSNPKEK